MKKFEEIDHLPRWAYHNDEWKEFIKSVDKIVNNKFFRLIDDKKIEKNKLDEFIKQCH